ELHGDAVTHLAVTVGLGEVDGDRHAHAVHFAVPATRDLGNDADTAAVEQACALRDDARPAEAASALHLVALDRQDDLAAAGIAGHQPKLGAQDVVEHGGKVAGRAALVGRAENELLFERLLKSLHRRIGA